ncbi:MAG: camphor resistance protein CrcB [Candidatus Handelsmanbacteria bacterium RIFCSPLOWO2_12_FULL_64_10]|uniref:Fluoride-specific ion channel FluC n=1 Tax=Handelsmanbacteria sp. (strain RIFCSPLOWO2_12_FULL_64_10) TaxID=1817868 RepID=A0A1F6D284_HANXR|nr:MAG: camphor resistance protein CrcB [Candidatus Handelsmanbacteria bacterium RIFCSPLOWO2_12_FULL_64_10]
MVERIIYVGIGGFIGANARYWLGGWISNRYGSTFPYATLVINITGSFILGLFMALITERYIAPPGLRLIVAIGFVGAYTTFSTFEYETLALASSGSLLRALLNIVLSVVAGFVAVWLGARLGRFL